MKSPNSENNREDEKNENLFGSFNYVPQIPNSRCYLATLSDVLSYYENEKVLPHDELSKLINP